MTFSISGVPANTIGITNAAGQPLAFGPNGTLVPYNLGTPTGNPVFWSGGDGIRLGQFSNLLSPVERINFDTIDNFKITDHVSAYAETWFAEVHAQNLIAQPAYNATIFGAPGTATGDFKIGVNNPFLTPADAALIKSELASYGAPLNGGVPFASGWNPSTFYLSRANADLESNGAVGDEVPGRGVAGLRGDFTISDTRNYRWDL